MWLDRGRMLDGSRGSSTLKKPSVFVFLIRRIPIQANVYWPWTDKKCEKTPWLLVMDGWTDKIHLCAPPQFARANSDQVAAEVTGLQMSKPKHLLSMFDWPS